MVSEYWANNKTFFYDYVTFLMRTELKSATIQPIWLHKIVQDCINKTENIHIKKLTNGYWNILVLQLIKTSL